MNEVESLYMSDRSTVVTSLGLVSTFDRCSRNEYNIGFPVKSDCCSGIFSYMYKALF